VRRACYGVIRTVMESGALGIEVIVSGKARVQRAKSMKFKSGFLITTGNPAKMFIDKATRHCMMKQGERFPQHPARILRNTQRL
jgi:ribosomal protein S3